MSNFQVGGHLDAKRLVPVGDVLYKPKSKAEFDFYEIIHNTSLTKFVPKYYGVEQRDFGYGNYEYIKIENLISSFKKPCVIDLKMGIRTWSDDCNEQKIISKKHIDETTTSNTYGFRYCGLKFCSHTSDSVVALPRDLLYDIKTYNHLKQLMKLFLLRKSDALELERSKITNEHEWSVKDISILESVIEHLKDLKIDGVLEYHQLLDKLMNELTKFKTEFEINDYELISSSIFMYFDALNPVDTVGIKMIDFAHWKDKEHKSNIDVGFVKGINTFMSLLNELRVEQ
ncbi:Kinase [Entamoeba marina]